MDEENILNYLQTKLPDYMLPHKILKLKEFPINANGKLDRQQLPDVELTSDIGYKAPRNNLENEITEIWLEI